MTGTDPRVPMQTIWQTQKSESMKMSVEEIREKSDKFEQGIRRRNLREYIAAAFVILVFAVYMVIFPNPVIRTGCVLLIAASLYVAYRLHRHGKAQALADRTPFSSCVAHYRAELVRQRDLLRSVMSWYIAPFVPGLVVFTLGIENMRPGRSGAILLTAIPVVAIALIIWALNSRVAKKLQREIDTLEMLEN